MSVSRSVLYSVLCSAALLACREELPLNGHVPAPFLFRLQPGTYFSFDNWKLDGFGQRISSSYYRSSWTVTDTGRTIRGEAGVTVVVDSTFDTSGVFTRRDSLFFRTGADGDLYQWSFLYSLIAERESLQLVPQWDKIAAFSLPRGASWVVATIDTSIGAKETETVYGRIEASSAYVGPMIINGEERTILSSKVEIIKPRMYYALWISDSPSTVARMLDDSDILRNAVLRELKVVRMN